MIWNGLDMSKSHMVNDCLRHCRRAADALFARSASKDRESGDVASAVCDRANGGSGFPERQPWLLRRMGRVGACEPHRIGCAVTPLPDLRCRPSCRIAEIVSDRYCGCVRHHAIDYPSDRLGSIPSATRGYSPSNLVERDAGDRLACAEHNQSPRFLKTRSCHKERCSCS
ncbi:hypothetical protein D3C76_110530 [compost metagenome]